ncbi:MAG: flagellin B [Sulfuricurvum sp.]|jgi:flagellin|uniref:flagellin B n=1 Tax=Sulfuricurvum sp. TaxID=2025608 RepID=UPI0025F3CA57|nr:flagellin B [Sulfuricurvum sp.]MCI4406152.1 flagellin B [Sulfuricurvum sp.]
MGFRINTNIAAMNAHTNAMANNRNLDSSLSKLSSGLRINSAADDASGMAIADSLRSQASSLGQAIANANDGVGIIQTADKAMDEQLKILDTIKTKATQAAQDGQTSQSRQALQKDIARLMENLNNIASQTSFNGQNLLNGGFTNKEFQVGAFSNETVKVNIGATNSNQIGHIRTETGKSVTAAGTVSLKIDGVSFESVTVSTSAGTGLGQLATIINKNQDALGVRASATVAKDFGAVAAGDTISLTINGVKIGTISGILANDSDGRLVNAINAQKTLTGVEASTDKDGHLILKSDGRGVKISRGTGLILTTQFYGRLTLTKLNAGDIQVAGTGAGLSSSAVKNLRLTDVIGKFDKDTASAAGANIAGATALTGLGTGVTTLKGAMLVMDIAQSAQKMLDGIRSDLGSTQNQLISTINNISVTQVNVKAAESQIRDVDFAAESANFSKFNILAQSGSYAMSQANAVQQNVLRLLQ